MTKILPEKILAIMNPRWELPAFMTIETIRLQQHGILE